MLEIKDGVKVNGISTEILLAIVISKECFQELGYDTIITECTGGKHGYGSLHYIGYAVDLRTRHVQDKTTLKLIYEKIKYCLGKQYDVVLEDDHIHIEYQPKI